MVNDLVDNVYVLNLQDELFKYEILKRKLDCREIKHDRFVATSGRDCGASNLEKYLTLGKIINEFTIDGTSVNAGASFQTLLDQIICQGAGNMINGTGALRSEGAMGCVHSNIRIFQDALDNGYENILILQDDVYFHKEFEKLLKEHEGAIKSSDIFYLGASEHSGWVKKTKWQDPNWNYYRNRKESGEWKLKYKPHKETYGLFAVILAKKVFRPALDLLKFKFFAADQCINLLASNIFLETSWVAYPNLIIPDMNFSRTFDRPFSKGVRHRDSGYAINMGWNSEYYDLTERYYEAQP